MGSIIDGVGFDLTPKFVSFVILGLIAVTVELLLLLNCCTDTSPFTITMLWLPLLLSMSLENVQQSIISCRTTMHQFVRIFLHSMHEKGKHITKWVE